MRRWIWRILLAAMVAASLAGTALAAETRGLKWEQVGDEWKVTGYEGTATKVEIPSTHEGKPVTQIGKNAFAMSGITSVDIPGSIKSIDEQAFASCAKLTTVTFHDSSEEGSAAPGSTVIGESAFFNCGITTLNLSNSVKSIGENAFANCKMSEVVILDSTDSIAAGAFSGCGNLSKAAISGKDSPVTVAPGAFPAGGKLKELHCQGTVTFTGDPDANPWKDDSVHTVNIVSVVVPATCQKAGSIKKTVGCTETAAKCTFKGEDRTIPKLAHDFRPDPGYTPETHPPCEDWVETYPATCTKCQTHQDLSVAHPHTEDHKYDTDPSPKVETTPPTCIKEGLEVTTWKCQNPGCNSENVTRKVLPKNESHTYENKTKVLRSATCVAPGYEAVYSMCKDCGTLNPDACSGWDHAKDEEYNQKLLQGEFDTAYEAHLTAGHSLKKLDALTGEHTWGEETWGYEKEADKPTCTAGGKETAMQECTVCNEKKFDTAKTRDVQPLGHDYDLSKDFEEVTEEATCTENGKKTTTGFCMRENRVVTEEEVLPATGHNYVPLSDSAPGGVLKEATCTEPGRRVSGGEQCTKCFDIKDSGEDIEIPPLGHLWGSPVLDETAADYKAPTCTETGEATGTVTCTRTGCHSDPADDNSPPVTQNQRITLPALGHDWGEWTVTKEPTEKEAGSRERVCKREGCEEKEVREIPPLDAPPTDPDDPDKPTDPDNPDKPAPPEESTYKVDVIQASNGTTYVSRSTAKEGDVVTITVTPNSGYVLDMIRVIGGSELVKLTDLGGGQYRFVMPASNVEVRATFDRTGSDYGNNWTDGFGNSGSGDRSDPRRTTDVVPVQIQEPVVGPAGASQRIFQDIPTTHWAAGEINWASEMGYMSGSGGRFNPGENISQQQMWMVLARLCGEQPASMAEARRWAELGGYADGSAPTAPVKRHQLVTALYRCARLTGRTARVTVSLSGYADSRTVPTVAREAFTWALTRGIVSGDAEGRLKPAETITRDQFAVILYRYSHRM